jgi:glutaredoxin-related protein
MPTANNHVEEIRKFFTRIKAPIKLRDFCFMLPDSWFFTDLGFESLAVLDNGKVYLYHIDVDYEIVEDEESGDEIVKRMTLRNIELVEVVEATSYDAFGLFEEGNLCTPYTEWGM